jgi:hypothetical protein
LEYIAKSVVIAKGAANHVKLKELPVVNEFSDVFSEELPVMPPDRDIEFVIVYLKLLIYVRNPIGWPLSN